MGWEPGMIRRLLRCPVQRHLRWGVLGLVIGFGMSVPGCEQDAGPPVAMQDGWREFEGTWSGAGMRRTIPVGGERRASIIELRGTMLLAGAGRPGVGFRAEIIALVDSASGLEGRGVWIDERGDEVYSELTGEGTRENNRIVGTFVGGTGRYSGVSGGYEFAWQYVIESDDGSRAGRSFEGVPIQGRAVGLKGRYRVEPSTAPGADQ
ncbi:MAG: hypothetical protein GIKADHBN_01864 [Phycisphaerales bacterium]|nr:hypothetical protein [Phycisphaerales bacterium]